MGQLMCRPTMGPSLSTANVDRTLEYELVSADTSGEFEVLSLTISPGGSTGAVANSHPGERGSVVLRGEVIAEVPGQSYDLGTGDSIKPPRTPPPVPESVGRRRRSPDHHQLAQVLSG